MEIWENLKLSKTMVPHRAENGNLGIFEAVENHGKAFASKQSSYQKVAVDMEHPKMQ